MRYVLSAVVVGAAALAVAWTAEARVSFKLVANPSVPVSSLTRAAASKAFLKKTEKWPDGTAVVPIDQARGSSTRESFCREVHDRSTAMIDAFWQKQVYSGRGTPPLTKGSDREVIEFVRSVPGAIGYVSANADTSGVKEIPLE
jgi:ABC-type phosphate transport system substrate-binding protein